MKIRFYMLACAALLMASCAKEEPQGSAEPVLEEMEFTAYSGVTKTSLNADGKTVEWSLGDRISIYDGQGNREFTVTSVDGNKAVFKGTALKLESGNYYAVYPYDQNAGFNGNNISSTLPDVHTAVENGFDAAASVSVAKAEASDNTLYFQNVCGLLRFTLDETMDGVTSVKFVGTSALTGAFTVDLSGEKAAVTATGETVEVVLNDVEPGKTYNIPVLPSEHTSIKFTLVKEGETADIVGNNPLTVERAAVKDFGVLKADAFAPVKTFEMRVLEGGGHTVTEGYELPAEGITGELYMNVTAADDVEWYITVTRNGEEYMNGQIGIGNKATGSASRWFKVPEARESAPVEWTVNVITEDTEVADQTLRLNFVQKTGLFRLDNFGGYTDTMPAVVKADGDQKDMYIIVYATEGLQWTGTVKKNDEDYKTITGTGRLTQDSETSSHIWIPNNTTAEEIVWTVTVTTESEVSEPTQTLTITQAAGEVSEVYQFEFNKLDGSGYNLQDGDQIGANGANELYMNMYASAEVTWTIKVYKDGVEHSGGQIGYTVTGSGSRWFPVPANTTTSVVNWRVVAVTDNTNVADQEVEINFTQAAGEATKYFNLKQVHIKGTNYTQDGEFALNPDNYNGDGNADAYIDVESNVSWTWKVYRNEVEYAGGSAEGTPGGRMFWIPQGTDVTWRIVISTEDAAPVKEHTITLIQRS